MRKLFVILSCCLITVIAMGQVSRSVIDKDGRPKNYQVSALNSAIPLFLAVDKNTRAVQLANAIMGDPLSTIAFLDGATTANITTRLRKDSLRYYRYSVIENDSVTLVSNALLNKVDFVWNDQSAFPGYLTMNLGISNIVNKKLAIKIYRLPKENLVTTFIIYNKPLKPAQVLLTVLATQGKPLKSPVSYVVTDTVYSKKHKATNFGKAKKSVIKRAVSYFPDTIHLKKGATIDVTRKTRGIYFYIKKTDLDFIYRVYVRYENAAKTERTCIPLPATWIYTADGDPLYFVDADYFNKPGNYEIVTAPQKSRNADLPSVYLEPAQIAFTVLSPPMQYSVQNLLLLLALVVIAAVVIILLMRRNNKKKLTAAIQRTETTKSELNTIRAQLNPHFVFNALSGIQNLMNKNEVEMANNYLDKFARLTRQVLDDHPTISIKDEMSLLNDYLAMEQLRFPFNYEIHADDSTNFTNIEIPAMLLQPFVENAVKHGIAHLKTEGTIVVNFTRQGKQLMLTVTDNGNGFDTARNYEGWGLKLSKKRIALLNDVYKECPITLQVDSEPSNTTVSIILSQWL